MKYFFLKLIAPRPDFAQTMTAKEKELMQKHGEYLRGLMDQGLIAAFGPVITPAGAFGMGLFTLPAGLDPKSLVEDDPTMKANIGFSHEIYPMPQVVLKK